MTGVLRIACVVCFCLATLSQGRPAQAQGAIWGADLEGAMVLKSWRNAFPEGDDESETLLDDGTFGAGLWLRSGYMFTEAFGAIVNISAQQFSRKSPEEVRRAKNDPTQMYTMGLGARLKSPSLLEEAFMEFGLGGTYAMFTSISHGSDTTETGHLGRGGWNAHVAVGYTWAPVRLGVRAQRIESDPSSPYLVALFVGVDTNP